jgi:hypothetical protein
LDLRSVFTERHRPIRKLVVETQVLAGYELVRGPELGCRDGSLVRILVRALIALAVRITGVSIGIIKLAAVFIGVALWRVRTATAAMTAVTTTNAVSVGTCGESPSQRK